MQLQGFALVRNKIDKSNLYFSADRLPSVNIISFLPEAVLRSSFLPQHCLTITPFIKLNVDSIGAKEGEYAGRYITLHFSFLILFVVCLLL